ncbi:IPT/TIG domain-containing protein [Candidatus Peregrinibacteria bacterium]|nr:IPT/TIG domain-containing protein [Candidatus Peregrinibacteria bacterium]
MKFRSPIVILIILLLGVGVFGIILQTNFFKATLFQGGNEPIAGIAQQIYIPNNYRAAPGQIGEIEVRSNFEKANVTGLRYLIYWDATQLKYRGYVRENLPWTSDFTINAFLANQETETDNAKNMIARLRQTIPDLPENLELLLFTVQGDSFISVSKNAILSRLQFEVMSGLAENIPLHLSFYADETAVASLGSAQEKEIIATKLSPRNGLITVDFGAKLQNETAADAFFVMPGQTGKVTLTAPTEGTLSNVVGLSFTVEWNALQATFLKDIPKSVQETPFVNKDFLIETFQRDPSVGVLNVSMVTAKEGVNLASGAPIMNFDMQFAQNLVLGSSVPFTFKNITFVFENPEPENNILTPTESPPKTVRITVDSAGVMKLLSVQPISGAKLELGFSDYLDAAVLSDITITPNIITADTTLRIENKKLILENLGTDLSPDAKTIYRVDVSSSVKGNSEGGVHPSFSTGFFEEFTDPDPEDNAFGLQSAVPSSPSSLILTFSANISSPEMNTNFVKIYYADEAKAMRELNISKIEKQGNTLTLTTREQTPGREYFVIALQDKWKNADNKFLTSQNGLSFFGYTENRPRITSVSSQPPVIINSAASQITLLGQNFAAGSMLLVGDAVIVPTSITSSQIVFSLPAEFPADTYTILLRTSSGDIITAPTQLIVNEPELEFKILSDQSRASPSAIENDGIMKTKLWVLVVNDIDGVSDIEKVTGDLELVGGSRIAEFTSSDEFITGNQRWYSLEITVPSSVHTSETPYLIPVKAESRRTERTAAGTVSFSVVKDIKAGTAPQILSASVSRTTVAPDAGTPLTISVEARDEDGASDIYRVIVDLSKIGLPNMLLSPLSEKIPAPTPQQKRACTADDYTVTEYGACTDGTQTRSVQRKTGIDCVDGASKPPSSKTCTAQIRACTVDDYNVGEYGTCTNGTQSRSVTLKSGVTCIEGASKPQNSRTCTPPTSFWENLFPKAFAEESSSVDVATQWFESDEIMIPKDIVPGTYTLPITVIDTQSKEARTSVTINIQRNTGGTPTIAENIFVSPSKSMIKDGKTKHIFSAKATDRVDGGKDIESMIADLSDLDLPPTPMKLTLVQGDSAFFTLDNIVIPEKTIQGFKAIKFSVSDKSGNTSEVKMIVEVVRLVDSPDAATPEIKSDRGYMTPVYAPNDGKTRFTVYVFARDGNGYKDIDYVTLELGNVARFVGKTSSQYNPSVDYSPAKGDNGAQEEKAKDDGNQNNNDGNDGASLLFFSKASAAATPQDNKCVTTDTIMCLSPSVSEGEFGRWFYAPDLVIPKTTPVPANGEPFELRVSVTDSVGRSGNGIAKIFVSDGNTPDQREPAPYLKQAVAVGPDVIETIFSAPVEASRISDGAFTIVEAKNIKNTLDIEDIDISSSGLLITIHTEQMTADEPYTLIVDAEKLKLNNPRFSTDRVNFLGFSAEKAKNSRDPSALVARAVGDKRVEVQFNVDMKFSTLDATGKEWFRIYGRDDITDRLPITHVEIGKNSKTVLVYTEQQISGKEYALELKNIESIFGKKRPYSKALYFLGYKNTEKTEADARTKLSGLEKEMDANGDDEINFYEFSKFAATYGQTASDGKPLYGDYNKDSKVDFEDFIILAAHYGITPPKDTKNVPPFPQDEVEKEEQKFPA